MQERIWWALNRGEVAMTQGPITLEVSDKTYYVNTPDKSLKISDSVHKALSEGMTYQLYYLSGTDYLLSAQPLAPMTKRPRTMQRRPLPIMEAPPEKQKRDEKHKHDEKPKREEKRKSSWG